MSVYENLRYPLDILKLPSAQKKEIISYTAKKLEITELLERKPSQLSGGTKSSHRKSSSSQTRSFFIG